MFGLLIYSHLITCWIWPFVFVFNLRGAIHGPQTADSIDMSRTAHAVWAGIALAMMTAVPYCALFLYAIN